MTDKIIKVSGWMVAQKKPGVFRLKRGNRVLFVAYTSQGIVQCDKAGNPSPTFISALTSQHRADIAKAVTENFDVDTD